MYIRMFSPEPLRAAFCPDDLLYTLSCESKGPSTVAHTATKPSILVIISHISEGTAKTDDRLPCDAAYVIHYKTFLFPTGFQNCNSSDSCVIQASSPISLTRAFQISHLPVAMTSLLLRRSTQPIHR